MFLPSIYWARKTKIKQVFNSGNVSLGQINTAHPMVQRDNRCDIALPLLPAFKKSLFYFPNFFSHVAYSRDHK